MCTFKICVFKHQKRRDGKYPVSIRVTWKRKSVYIKTEFYAVAQQINNRRGIFELKDTFIINKLNKRIEDYERKKITLPRDIDEYNAKELAQIFVKKNYINVFEYFDKKIETSSASRKDVILAVKNSIGIYIESDTLPLQMVTYDFVNNYYHYLRDKKQMKSPQYYIIVLKTICNLIIKSNPDLQYRFPEVKLDLLTPRHRNLSVTDIRKIRDASLSPKEELARDIFMLSFYLCGCNLTDLYDMKKPKNGYIEYCRNKTKGKRKDSAFIRLQIQKEAKPIIAKYAGKNSLLKFMETKTYEQFYDIIRSGLIKIGKKLNIESDFTFYSARHSWATIARNDCRCSKADVADALNHSMNTITDTYLAKDFTHIDRCNRLVLDFIL